MLALNNGDIIQGDATNANQVDYSFYGYKNSVLTALANGQLPAVKGILYTAASADAVLSIVLVNTGAMVNNINLYYLPASSPQTSRRLIAQNLQLPAGYSLHFDGHTVTVLSNTGAVVYVGATGQGFNWRGAWVSGNNYAAYDVLTNAGNSYQCILAINNSITVPGSDPTHFSLFVSIGSTGSPGSVWYNSIGVPSGATGILGDYDLNVVNGDVYQKQGSSPSWTLVGNIRGLQGIQGPAGNIPNVIATGTSDAIIVTYTPPIVLTDLMIVAFRATAKNLTTSPSFTPNGLATLPLNKYGGQSVAIGDIPAAGADCIVQYNATSPAFWDLLNPASVGLTPATAAQIIAGSPAGVYIAPDQLNLANIVLAPQIRPISATVGANALTINLANTALDFRSATLTSGTITSAIATGALSIVVPSTATLGTINAVQAMLAVLVAYNAGTPILCIVNMAGGVNLDETTVISPTTIDTGADLASIIYSASACGASTPFRVVGYILITEGTAGTWATAPSLIQGVGGQAFVNQQTLGMGQTYVNYTSSGRTLGTTYYNTTSKPIAVDVSTYKVVGNDTLVGYVAGQPIANTLCVANNQGNIYFIVPPGMSYEVTGTTINSWWELR
jgi:hypothetical protein